MSYKHLTTKQRNSIEILLKEGYSMSKIAKKIGVNVSIVSREIKICTGETYVSEKGKSKECLATFVERKTRFYLAIPMVDRSKSSMLNAIKVLYSLLPNKYFQSFISDRGKEFSCYKDVEKLGIDFYFADPYSSWQRGSNENSNGLLKEYYPKKTNLSNIDLNELI